MSGLFQAVAIRSR